MDKGFVGYIKENKRLWRVILPLALGIILILISSAISKSEGESPGSENTLGEYKEGLEREIADLCSDIEGVGRCRVFITFERGEQSIYKGSSVIETKPPKILGVSVICQGADNQTVRARIVEMITSLFGIGANRVAVLKLNS